MSAFIEYLISLIKKRGRGGKDKRVQPHMGAYISSRGEAVRHNWDESRYNRQSRTECVLLSTNTVLSQLGTRLVIDPLTPTQRVA